MNMSTRLLTLLLLLSAGWVAGQNQIDVREQTNVRVEHRFTQDFSIAFMGAAILTNDLQELGFVYLDGGFGFKITPNWGVNANYRRLYRRNLYNAYDTRHLLYADLDYSKRLRGRWFATGTLRLQALFYNHLFQEGPRLPNYYARTRLGLRYKVNYYWQPFVESEMFTPLFNPQRPYPDQIRASVGLAYTFNRYVRVEVYEQIQQQFNASSTNLFFMTAINWGLLF